MIRPVRWSLQARDDLAAIVRFVRERNPAAARRVALRIKSVADGLREFATGRTGRVEGVYEKSVPGLPYIIVYELMPGAAGREEIGIAHIVHTSRDWRPGEWPPM